MRTPNWVSTIIIAVDRVIRELPRDSCHREVWQTFRDWYSWKCDVCGKRTGSMQMTLGIPSSLRCQAHRLDLGDS